jgi:myo-inositol-1(or 4)-monophosphatase
VTRLSEALVLTTDPRAVADDPGWQALQRRAGTVRGWSDCYGHALVATGRAEVMLDPVMNSWDSGPFLPILSEAGGRFTNREGVETIHGGSAVSSNGALHAEVLEALAR